MNKKELLYQIDSTVKNGLNIFNARDNGLGMKRSIDRLISARRDIKRDTFEAIEYTDIFIIKNEHLLSKGISYKTLSEMYGNNIENIEGLRTLSISFFDRLNDFKGEDVYIN